MDIEQEKFILRQLRTKYSQTAQPGVSIIVPTNKAKYIDNIYANFMRSSYVNKELILILNSYNLDYQACKTRANVMGDNIKVFCLNEIYTLGECLNFGIAQSKHDYIAKMDDDDFYGTNYLTDLMNVFKYTDAQLTGKGTHFIYFEDKQTLSLWSPNCENRYVNGVAGATLVAAKEIFQKIGFKHMNAGEDVEFLNDCHKLGVKIYAGDKFNYVYMKHHNINEHTWKIKSETLSKLSSKIVTTDDYIPLITV